MAAVDGASLILPDILECSLCVNTLKAPKVLSCIHTFCLQCLEAYYENNPSEDGIRACPLCGKTFSTPAGGIKNLTDNLFIQQLLDAKICTELRSTDESSTCEVCPEWVDKVASECYCIDCRQYMCKRCSASHKKTSVARLHEMVPSVHKPSSVEQIKFTQSYCDEHRGERHQLYCYDCAKVLCNECLSEHYKHAVVRVHKSAKTYREKLKSALHKVLAYAGEKREEIIQLDNGAEIFVDKVADVQREISQKYERLMALISAHESKLTNELNRFKERTLAEKERKKDEKEKRRAMAESFKIYCVEVMTYGSDCEISRTADELLARAAEIVASRDDKPADGRAVEITFEPSCFETDDVENLLGVLVFNEVSVSTPEEREDKKFNLRAFFRESKTIRVLEAGHIRALAVLADEVFVVCGQAQIEVHSADSFSKTPRHLSIPGSNSLHRIAACPRNNCLYAADSTQATIYRYDLASDSTTKWTLSGNGYELSLTQSSNVLCVSVLLGVTGDEPRVEEYDTHGTFIRLIVLNESVDGLRHCVQLSTGNYVVCHTGLHHQVFLMDQYGQILKTYVATLGSPKAGGICVRCNPVHMCVDAHDNVLFTDLCNSRVQLLSASLSYLGDLVVPGHEPFCTDHLHLDELNRRLYIKEYCGEQRILVVDVDDW